jgi:hypothetical protein
MTEEQIERHIERAMDSLDRQLMRGDLSQADYNKAARELNNWAEAQYAARGRR